MGVKKWLHDSLYFSWIFKLLFFFNIWKVFHVIKNTTIHNERKPLNSDKEPHCTDIMITNISLLPIITRLNIMTIHA